MFMKNGKKKTHPFVAIGVGAMALYGAYSVVSCIKDTCCEKAQMLTKALKKKKNEQKCEEEECEPYD
ncbi:MAG: hypothetical protein IJY23_03995 [Clostridia bacterium]|nr:hypothetical protein [Clostridia bacterium]